MTPRWLIGLAVLFPFAAAAQPTAAARHMAATANPLASEAARSVLRDGGSAADAAIAAQMVLGVVEPQASGLGGGSLLLVWDATAKKLSFFDGLASAPASVFDSFGQGKNGGRIPAAELERSGLSVAVPGTLRTLGLIHARYGRLPWARLFADAIRLADSGFPVPPYLEQVLRRQPTLIRAPEFRPLYFDADSQPLPVGATIRNPALAATLRRIAAEGPEALSHGEAAERIVQSVATGRLPGAMSAADLAGFTPKERPPVCAVAFGRRVCSAGPASSGGIAVLQMLFMAERAGIARTAPGSVAAAHILLDVSRLAEADRRAYVGDPDTVAVPVAGLLDPGYLASRAALIAPDHALADVQPGILPGRQGALPVSDPLTQPATTHIAIVDDAGNAVSFTTTINLDFGAFRMADGYVLNDALTNFASTPVVNGVRVPNAMAPGKRPVSTMAPTIVFGADGRPELVVGAGGGARIIDSVAETIIGVLAWGQDVRTAISQPRIGAQNRAQELERGTSAAALADPLRAMGHDIHVDTMNAGVQAIQVTPQGLRGWGDPRRDGVALGD